MPAAQVVPAAAAQVSDTDVQPPELQEVGQQAGHEHTPVSATIAEEADDQVNAGLTQCLAQVLDSCTKPLLAHVCCRIDIVGAEVAVQ